MVPALALATWLAAAGAAPLFHAPREPLDPEKAFRVTARVLDGKRVEIVFSIAAGYYLYRDRFRFATESGEPLAEIEIPRGKLNEDAFFGRAETFRDRVRIRVAVSSKDAARGRVRLKITSQGCADIGVCYTPHEQLVTVRLPGGRSP